MRDRFTRSDVEYQGAVHGYQGSLGPWGSHWGGLLVRMSLETRDPVLVVEGQGDRWKWSCHLWNHENEGDLHSTIAEAQRAADDYATSIGLHCP